MPVKKTPTPGIPLTTYSQEVLSGTMEPGNTGNLSETMFLIALRRSHFTEETIRCEECFDEANLGCPGFVWLGNVVMEKTLEVGLCAACPLDVTEDGALKADGSDIMINLSRRLHSEP